MAGVLHMYEHTKSPRWGRMARDIDATLLYVQAPNGGLIHAAAEAEPAYVPEITCPILQFLPIHVLLDYYTWPRGDVPDPAHMPSGCPFHARCIYVKDICRGEATALVPIAKGSSHGCACHFSRELQLKGARW